MMFFRWILTFQYFVQVPQLALCLLFTFYLPFPPPPAFVIVIPFATSQPSAPSLFSMENISCISQPVLHIEIADREIKVFTLKEV